MPNVPAETLRQLARAILEGVGTPADAAGVVGDSLIDANLAGHDSHGVIRLGGYVEAVKIGQVMPTETPDPLGRDRATSRIDGRWGWGQPGMLLATAEVIALGREFGAGVAVVHRCSHIGRVAPYVESVARAGLIGIALSNAGPAVAPYGGSQRVMGTNPIAWAVPRGEGRQPLSFDIATAAVAEGKLRVAQAKGERVAPGLIVDVDGHPSQNPDDFYAGGALLPFGGHKGYGFSLLAQMLGRGLAGLDPSDLISQRGVNGPVIIAIDVSPFVAPEVFVAMVEAQCVEITASPPADGVAEVLLPGELEIRMRERRLAEGVPIAARTWAELGALATDAGVLERSGWTP